MAQKKKKKKKENPSHKFDALYPVFVAWYATPPHLRPKDLQTEGHWRLKYETSWDMISKIKKTASFSADVVEEYNKGRDERTFLVRQKLFDKILKDGESKAIKLYFEYEEKWSQRITSELIYDPKTVGEAMLLAKQGLVDGDD